MGSYYHVPENAGSNGIQVFFGGNNSVGHPPPLALPKTHPPTNQPYHDPPQPSPSPSPETNRPEWRRSIQQINRKLNLLIDAAGLSHGLDGGPSGHANVNHIRSFSQARGRQATESKTMASQGPKIQGTENQAMKTQADQRTHATSAVHVPRPMSARIEGRTVAAVPGRSQMTPPGGHPTGSNMDGGDGIRIIASASLSDQVASRQNSLRRSSLPSTNNQRPVQGSRDKSAARTSLPPGPKERNQDNGEIANSILPADSIRSPNPSSFSQPNVLTTTEQAIRASPSLSQPADQSLYQQPNVLQRQLQEAYNSLNRRTIGQTSSQAISDPPYTDCEINGCYSANTLPAEL